MKKSLEWNEMGPVSQSMHDPKAYYDGQQAYKKEQEIKERLQHLEFIIENLRSHLEDFHYEYCGGEGYVGDVDVEPLGHWCETAFQIIKGEKVEKINE